jgi:hypothetical protein
MPLISDWHGFLSVDARIGVQAFGIALILSRCRFTSWTHCLVQIDAGHEDGQSAKSRLEKFASIGRYTIAAGKNYSGSVEESGGMYLASVPNPPPGVSASGPSVQSAEDNLNIKLDAVA